MGLLLFIYLFISPEAESKQRFSNLNTKFNYNNVEDGFKGKIVIFDKNNAVVSNLDFNETVSNNGDGILGNQVEREDTMTCHYIGWAYSDGSFEPIMLLYCSGAGGDTGTSNGDVDYGDSHGSGGGATSTNQNIIDNLEGYPCAQEILKQLPNLNNDLARLFSNLFKNSDKYNITFKPKSRLGMTDGITSSGGSKEFGTFKVTIFLNDEVLKHATKEYILITMYHEVIHAYLDYEKFTLGDVEFERQFPNIIIGNEYLADGTIKNRYFFDDNHAQFGPYLSELKQILKSYNSRLSDETASALAKFGITSLTNKEEEINKNERDTTKGTYTGTKCP